MGNRLRGRVAVITGASRGIGRAVALLFAREGASVCVNYLAHATPAKLVAKAIENLGSRAIAVRADVRNVGQVRNMVASTTKKLGSVDILVNNAGILHSGDTFAMEGENVAGMTSVNVNGVMNCTKEVQGQMIVRRYGKIVNIASIAGIGTAARGTTAYAISKGGVIVLTKRLALELGRYGVNVNAVAPGYIRTDMTLTGKTKKEFEDSAREVSQKTILERIGTPEDVANAVLFLASDEASFITGQVLTVDGGRMDFLSHSM